MAYNAHILLGRITKVHGYEGAVTVKLEKTFTEENIPVLESVFLEIEGKPVPFFISESEYKGADILQLKFENYESAGKVREFAGCRVFLTSGEPNGLNKDIMEDLAGYEIFLPGNTNIGTIEKIIENPGQILLVIKDGNGREILIPFHRDFIIDINNKKRMIKMDLPEGLTDLN